VKCAAEAHVGESGVTATVVASDGESGLATDPSGAVPISTERAGSVTTTRTAIDNVGHQTTRSCTTQVRESPPEFGRCVTAPSEKVGSKTFYHGFFTTSSCVTRSATQTSKYEWISGVVHKGFTDSFTTTPVLETASKLAVSCTSGTGSGTITTAKTVGGVVLKLTGCATNGNKCTTSGQAEGTLTSKTLEGVLGVYRTTIKEGKEIRYAGLDLYPVGKTGVFMEFTCAGETPTSTTLTGAVIAQMSTDKMTAAMGDKYVQSAGKQNPERFEGGEKQVLTNSKGEQVGLKGSVTQTNEEALEINAFF
jgi:hypothetical protein